MERILRPMNDMSRINNLPDQSDVEAALRLDQKSGHSRWVKRLLWLGLALVVLAGIWYFWQTRQTQNAAIVYETTPAALSDLTVQVTATGTIQPLTQVDVSSELSGVVREVLVDDNDIIQAGQVLARVDTTKLEATKAQVEARLDSAKAQLDVAQVTVVEKTLFNQRQLQTRAQGLTTANDADAADAAERRAVAALAAAKADVKAVEAELAQIASDIKGSEIRSPIQGIVLKRAVEPGQTVAASFQSPVLFTLAQDLSRMQLEAAVDEADVGVVKVGQKASFSVDAYRERNFPATIEQVSFAPETKDGVVTYKTTLSVLNDELVLRPGMTATAKITVEEFKNVLTVTNESLRYTAPRIRESSGFSITQMFMPRFPRADRGKRVAKADGTRDIYVLRNGKPVAVSIKTGASDGKITLIASGELKDGDEVIVSQRLASQQQAR